MLPEHDHCDESPVKVVAEQPHPGRKAAKKGLDTDSKTHVEHTTFSPGDHSDLSKGK